MEANTFIKSVEVEGNKIKDIKFYGDWEISTAGGEGPTVTKYVFADGALVENEAAQDDPFISLSVGTDGTAVIATVNFMTDAYMVCVRGNNDNAFATQYEIFAGTQGVKIPAGESKSLTIYHSYVASNIKYISIILITEKALVKVYKFTTDYLRSLL